eukprot:gene18066-23713_t
MSQERHSGICLMILIKYII